MKLRYWIYIWAMFWFMTLSITTAIATGGVNIEVDGVVDYLVILPSTIIVLFLPAIELILRKFD